MKHHIRANEQETSSNTNAILNGRLKSDSQSAGKLITSLTIADELEKLLQQVNLPCFDELIMKLAATTGKKSFLVFKNNKYFNVATEKIAFFYVRNTSASMMCFDQQEYFVHYSLEQIQTLLPVNQFFRLNRQYLINFLAIKDVEHYFARKLLVNSIIAAKEKLLVSKEKVSEFLNWLDNR